MNIWDVLSTESLGRSHCGLNIHFLSSIVPIMKRITQRLALVFIIRRMAAEVQRTGVVAIRIRDKEILVSGRQSILLS